MVLALCFLAIAFDVGLARLSYGLLLPAIRTDLGGSYATYGAIAAWNLAGYVAGNFIAPAAIRIGGMRNAFAASHGLAALLLALSGTAGSPLTLGIVRTLLGVATAIGVVTALGTALSAVAPSRRALASATTWSGIALALIASAAIAPSVLSSFERWRVVTVCMSLVGLLVALGARYAAASPVAIGGDGPAFGLRDLLRPRRFLFFGLAYLGFGAAYIAYATFLVSALTKAGFGAQAIGAVWAAYGCAAAVGVFAIVAVQRSRLRRYTLVIPLVFGAAGAAVSMLPTVSAVVAGALCAGLGLAAAPAVVTTITRERSSSATAPAAFASMTAIFGVGQMLGPLAGGAIADALSPTVVPAFAAALFMVAAVMAMLDAAAVTAKTPIR